MASTTRECSGRDRVSSFRRSSPGARADAMDTSFFAPAFDVRIAGLTLAADVTRAVIELEYDNNIDTADMVKLTLNNSDLKLTDSALFDVGKSLEVHMGYRDDLHPMMLGEITDRKST